MAVIRVFFAFALDADARRRLGDGGDALHAPLALLPLHWIPAANWHITAEFLGATDRAHIPRLQEIARVALTPFAAITLWFDRWSWFPNAARPRLLALECSAPTAQPLQSALREALRREGFNVDSKPWRAHITLARVRKDERVALATVPPLPTPALPVVLET